MKRDPATHHAFEKWRDPLLDDREYDESKLLFGEKSQTAREYARRVALRFAKEEAALAGVLLADANAKIQRLVQDLKDADQRAEDLEERATLMEKDYAKLYEETMGVKMKHPPTADQACTPTATCSSMPRVTEVMAWREDDMLTPSEWDLSMQIVSAQDAPAVRSFARAVAKRFAESETKRCEVAVAEERRRSAPYRGALYGVQDALRELEDTIANALGNKLGAEDAE